MFQLSKKPHLRRVLRQVARAVSVCNVRCQKNRLYDRILPASFLLGVLLFLIYVIIFAPPQNFPIASLLKIPRGASAQEVAYMLKQKNIIHSQLLFEAIERLYGKGDSIAAGEYFFPEPQNVFTIAARLVGGDHELQTVRVTVPQGSNVHEIARLLAQSLPDFDSDTFLWMAQSQEGTLYPDTYFFLPGEDPALVMQAFENNFKLHIETQEVTAAITKFGKPLNDVLTMASLLEKEAATTKDREIISGILWHRIALDMPLQVDAVFPYIIGKYSLQLTRTDLATTSPYNTYTHRGLPPGPIGSPSLDAILDAVTPIKSNYLFYLSDASGVTHYSATYAGQLANVRKYLGS